MGSCGSPIKLDDGVPFVETEWIGQGGMFLPLSDGKKIAIINDMEIPFDFAANAALVEVAVAKRVSTLIVIDHAVL